MPYNSMYEETKYLKATVNEIAYQTPNNKTIKDGFIVPKTLSFPSLSNPNQSYTIIIIIILGECVCIFY